MVGVEVVKDAVTAQSWGHKGSGESGIPALGAEDLRSDMVMVTFRDGEGDNC